MKSETRPGNQIIRSRFFRVHPFRCKLNLRACIAHRKSAQPSILGWEEKPLFRSGEKWKFSACKDEMKIWLAFEWQRSSIRRKRDRVLKFQTWEKSFSFFSEFFQRCDALHQSVDVSEIKLAGNVGSFIFKCVKVSWELNYFECHALKSIKMPSKYRKIIIFY